MRTAVGIHPASGVAAVSLTAGELTATFLPSLGMLGTSLRYRGDEFIALPGGVAAYRAGGMTGLPLLAPWANRLDGRRYRAAGVRVDLRGLDLRTEENGLPIHGTIGPSTAWEVVRLEAGRAEASLVARFDYGSFPELLRAFPFPHELTVEARARQATLSVATSIRPTGKGPVPISFGFHPYLRLPSGGRNSWRLRLPRGRHVLLDERGIPTGEDEASQQQEAALGTRGFDDLFALDDDRRLWIADGERRVEVRLESGYPFAQVYGPPGRRFVCLEPMTAATNSLVTGDVAAVPAGEVFTARFSIAIGVTEPGS